MPHTPEPWIADVLAGGFVRISGPIADDGTANLVCIVDGANVEDDASLIVTSPTALRTIRDTSLALADLEMVLAEVGRVVILDRYTRLVVPALKRIRERRATLDALVARAEGRV